MDEYIKRKDVLDAISYNCIGEPSEITQLTLAVAKNNVRKIKSENVLPSSIFDEIEDLLNERIQYHRNAIANAILGETKNYHMNMASAMCESLASIKELRWRYESSR